MAAFEIQGKAGPQTNSDGVTATVRQTRSGGVVVQAESGRFREAVLRGNVYHACVPASVGVAPGTALGTAAAFALANPAGSGKNLIILQATLGYVSGTLGAGVIVWAGNFNPVAAAVSGTAIAAVNALLGSRNQASGAATYTATLPAAPTTLRAFCSIGPMLATSVVQPWQVIDEVDGAIQVAPGGAVSLQGIATAGTSPLLVISATWEEVPA